MRHSVCVHARLLSDCLKHTRPLPLVPAFSVSHASLLLLTQSERVAKVVVMGTHEQLEQLKESNFT